MGGGPLDPRVAEPDLIMTDAIPAVGGHEGEVAGVIGKDDVERFSGARLIEPALDHAPAIEIDGEIGPGRLRPAAIRDHRTEAPAGGRMPGSDRGQIEGDRGIGMETEHGMAGGGVVDAGGGRRGLGIDRAVADRIPPLPGRRREAVDRFTIDDEPDRPAAIGYEHRCHQ